MHLNMFVYQKRINKVMLIFKNFIILFMYLFIKFHFSNMKVDSRFDFLKVDSRFYFT